MWNPSDLLNPVLILLGLCTVIYLYLLRQFSFWSRKGVPFRKPHLIFGNVERVVKSQLSSAVFIRELYEEFKGEPFVGVYEFTSPKLLVRDPELVRTIFIRDFNSWMNRGFVPNEEVDALSAGLASLTGKRWKAVRSKLTPTFSSGKLKQMFDLLAECGGALESMLKAAANSQKPVDAREMSARFTTDVIGSCVFGIQMNAMSDEDAEFRRMGKKIFETSYMARLRQVIHMSLPRLFKMLKMRMMAKEIEEFFLKAFKDTMDYRETHNVVRHDFVDLLRKLRNEVEGDVVFDDKLLTAQAFVFFGAGFETSSTTMSYCMHELAANPDIQQRLREEVQTVLAKHNGQVTFDNLKEMEYLDMVFNETLRKHPPIPTINRQATKPYIIPGTDVEIPAGTIGMVSVFGIHRDPEYYPDPEKFDPERFTEAAKAERHPLVFIPFGGGPRICMGMRFADLQTKLGLVKVISNFKVSLSEKSTHPLKVDKRAQFMSPEGGIWLRISAL